LLLLGALMRPPEAPRLLLLLSSRTDILPDGLRDLAAGVSTGNDRILPGDLRRVDLGPLEPKMAYRLARILLHRASRHHDVSTSAIATEAQGHPLYIHELVRHATTPGAGQSARPRLDEAIWNRICQLPAPARAVLELVCVAAVPLPRHIIAHAARADSQELARQVALLRVAHLVRTGGRRDADTIEPYHNRVREAVLENVGKEERRDRHQRLAAALQGAGFATQRPQLLVRHLEGAGQIRKAAELAEEAARRAAEALAFDRAAELCRTALRLGDYEGAARLELQISLGDALANAGRCAEAARVYTEATEGADPATRLDCQRKAAQQYLIGGHIDKGLDLLDSVLADIGVSLARSPRRALASLLLQRLRLRMRGLGWREKHASQIAPEMLKRLDILDVVATGLGVVDTVRAMDFQARALRLALEAGERSRVAKGLCYESILVATKGGTSRGRAKALLQEARRAAGETEDHYVEAWTTSASAFLSYFGGHFVRAAEQYARAEVQFRERTVGSVWEINNVRVFGLHSLRLAGSFARLATLQDEYVRDAMQRGDRYMETTLRRANAVLSLIGDRPQDTLEELTRATWMAPEETFHLQHWYELEARGQLALYTHEVARAAEELAPSFERLARSLLLRLQTVRTTAHWLRARMHLVLAATDGAHAGRSLRQASRFGRSLTHEDVGYAKAWGLLVCAGVSARRGRTDDAVTKLRRAVETADLNSLAFVVALARRRLGELLEGEEGAAMVAAADEWMRGEGIVNPASLLVAFAPGFDGAGEGGQP